ncbi:MAG: S8 family serine peptidase [Chitinophagales bacterium]
MKTLKIYPTYFLLINLFIFSANSKAQTVHPDYWDGQVYVKVKNESNKVFPNFDRSKTTKAAIQNYPHLSKQLEKYEVETLNRPFQVLKTPVFDRTYRIYFKNVQNIDAFIKEIEQLEDIEYAEKVPIHSTSSIPNDSKIGNQWFLEAVDAYGAWDLIEPGQKITVAVVDQEVKWDHEDLIDNLWINLAENNGMQGIDDDGNGYIDDIIGWDAANNDNNPAPPPNATDDYFRHGTHVAGTVGATTNNGRGVAAISYNHASIMACKGGRDSDGKLTGIWDAFAYALVNNPDIITNSWGGGAFTNTGRAMLDEAHQRGILVLFSAGNDDTDFQYPAAYETVIAVAASGSFGDSPSGWDEKASYSNYGIWVDITAPGTGIMSCSPGDSKYIKLNGTSMACPNVASLLALMKSQAPNLSNQQLLNCLYSSADNIDAQNPNYIGLLGAGRINARKAIQCVKNEGGGTTCSVPIGLSVTDITEETARLEWNNVSGASGYNIEIRVKGNSSWYSFENNPFPNNFLNISGMTPNTSYEYRVQAVCSGSTSSFSNVFTFTSQSGGGGNNSCIQYKDVYDNLIEGGNCDNGTVEAPWEVWANEAYPVAQCMPNQSYIFSICDGYSSNNWEAELSAVEVLDGGELGVIFGNIVGCELIFTVPSSYSSPVDIALIVADHNDCGGEILEIDNGIPSFGCQESAANCSVPTGLSVINIQSNEALLVWNTVTSASVYNVQARPKGTDEWTEGLGIEDTDARYSGLSPCRDYEFRVQTVCSSGNQSEYSNIVSFKTEGCAPPCPAPTSVNLSNITAESARVSWSGNGNADSYLVNYRTSGSSTWQYAESTQTNLTLQNLVSCLTYEVQILGVCDGEESDASSIATFEATCVPCTSPSDIQTVAVTPTNATILWEQHPLALSYELRARDVGTNDWVTGEFDEIGVFYSGLEACENYEVQLKSICADGESSFGSSHIFTTAGCNGTAYCTSQGEVASYEWIESLRINNFTNTSGNNYGYAEFKNTNLFLEGGKSYPVTLTPGFSDEPFEEYWRIWIDFNKDGDFNDSNETVFDGGNPQTSTLNGNMLIPNNAAEGTTTMRVAMKWIEPSTDASLPDPCLTFGYGEVEDYTVQISNIVGIEDETSTPILLTLAPNPNNGSFQLSGELDKFQSLQIRVSDVLGREVINRNIEAKRIEERIELPNVVKGMYFLSVETENTQQTQPFIVK